MTSQQRQELERKKFLKTKPTFQQNNPTTTEKIKYGIADVLGQGANNMNYLAGTIGKYGSNLPADVISMVSPKVANTIGDYSAGLLAPTSKEEWNKYNSKSQLNRANIAAEALGNVLAGEVIGAGITKASPYIKKGISNVGKEVGERVRPYLVGESKIPMSGYKPVMNVVDNIGTKEIVKNTNSFRPRNPVSMVGDIM